MIVVKRIVRIDFDPVDEIDSYVVGTILREYEVKDILFRRDGYNSINKDGVNEGHYLIHLVNELNDKDVILTIIPKTRIRRLMFKEEEVELEKEAVKLERV